ncbi:hypothetical protein [Cobetia amphilecti]|uniref:hypothetical protein n=1 Tax=Cobetia amphilecti TaxID=1055104 RepID=UPI00254A4E97|nr:hypothetical protein [Cobetia amphilecti]
MDEWKRETQAGNALFEQGDYTMAEQHYLSACHFADIFLMPCADPDGGVAALVVSYQNLAELYRARTNTRKRCAPCRLPMRASPMRSPPRACAMPINRPCCAAAARYAWRS